MILIENEADYVEARALVNRLIGSGDESDVIRLRAQAKLVEEYEQGRWPRRVPTVPELLTYLMDQHGLARGDLIPLLGTASRVSEVLNGKAGLSMAMVRRLRARFGISADLLIPTEAGGQRQRTPAPRKAPVSSKDPAPHKAVA